MKHKILRKLIVGSLAAVVLLSGCGAQETISMGTGSTEESVKDERQDTVEITDIQWIMKDGSEFWHKYGSQSDEGFAIDEGMIVGKVVYSDGNEMEIEPESVTGTLMGYGNSCKINITYRDRVYEVTSLNPWGDSENPDELAAANSGRQLLIPSGSGSDGEVADVSGSVVLNPEGTETVSNTETSDSSQGTRYSIADCPELTNLDWDEFNEEALVVSGKHNFPVYTSDLFSKIGRDVRVDWSEINSTFNMYYGGEDGSAKFYEDLYKTYGLMEPGCDMTSYDEKMHWAKCMYIEPIRSNTGSGMYDDLYNELYEKVHSREAYSSEAEYLVYEKICSRGYDNIVIEFKKLNDDVDDWVYNLAVAGSSILDDYREGYLCERYGIQSDYSDSSDYLAALKLYDSLVRRDFPDLYDAYVADMENRDELDIRDRETNPQKYEKFEFYPNEMLELIRQTKYVDLVNME